jgi:hypothetical protein
MQDCCGVFVVYVIQDGLLTHKLKSVYAKKIGRLKKLHDIVQSDLAFISIEIVQNFNEYVLLNMRKFYLTLVLSSSLMQSNF